VPMSETQQTISFTPAIMWDRMHGMGLEGLHGYGARIRADTRCARCGRLLAAGEKIRAYLALDWDKARIEHEGVCP